MNLQILMVGAIVLLAFLYLGKSVWEKVKSFSATSSCATDCGCAAKSNGKSPAHIIKQ
jgi:hypothetical protein